MLKKPQFFNTLQLICPKNRKSLTRFSHIPANSRFLRQLALRIVQAILKGGVPVSEIEDDYMQETLDGMDVLSVFVRRDSNYYDFKAEIESKEQIRDHLNGADQSVLNQFERWWDKYRVSRHEIDAQVKRSEGVMWNVLAVLNGRRHTQVKQSDGVRWDYLKELGYE